jgi:hypothetical protein
VKVTRVSKGGHYYVVYDDDSRIEQTWFVILYTVVDSKQDV